MDITTAEARAADLLERFRTGDIDATRDIYYFLGTASEDMPQWVAELRELCAHKIMTHQALSWVMDGTTRFSDLAKMLGARLHDRMTTGEVT